VEDLLQQTSQSRTFTLETPLFDPGFLEVRAQLVDLDGEVLAETPDPITVYAQQKMDVTISGGTFEALSNPITLNVEVGPEINLNRIDTKLYVPGADAPYQVRDDSIQNGAATITIRDLQSLINEQVPSAKTGDVFQLRIEAPASSPGLPPLAEPYSINFEYVAPPAPPEPIPLPRFLQWLLAINANQTLLLTLITLALALFNIIMLIRVHRLRINRIIGNPDKIELSEQMMTVTVRQAEGKASYPLTKKTMTVGRGEVNDIDLGPSERVSRRHGVIVWRKGRWWYTNRKHNVWAIVEGKRIRGYGLVPLEAITEIEFPDAMMIFHSSAQQNVASLFSTDLGEDS
jgi:hypothetical protein